MKSITDYIKESATQEFNKKPKKTNDVNTFDVNVLMKDWFEHVSLDNFLTYIEDTITRSNKGDKNIDFDVHRGIKFKDGYFDIEITQKGGKDANFRIYFADKKLEGSTATLARNSQMKTINKDTNVFDRSADASDTAKVILNFIKENIDLIERKQFH